MIWEVRFTKAAKKDIAKLLPKLKRKLKQIIQNEIEVKPYSGKKIVGYLVGFYSIRLSLKDRVVYAVDKEEKLIYIHRAKTH